MKGFRLDPYAAGFFVIGILAATYLYIVEQVASAIYPVVLLVAAAGGMAITENVSTTEAYPEFQTILLYTLGALAVFVVTGFAVSAIPSTLLSVVRSLSTVDQGVFGVLMAIAEEFFFRGFIAGWLYVRQGLTFSVFGSAAIFTAYHLLVYGVSTNLIYVFVAGAVLAYVFLRTGSLVPDTLAHILNNLIAVGLI